MPSRILSMDADKTMSLYVFLAQMHCGEPAVDVHSPMSNFEYSIPTVLAAEQSVF